MMYRSRVKTMIKKAEQAIAKGEPNEGTIKEAIATIDKAAVKGIIHKNNAARRKSRLMKRYNDATRQQLATAVAAEA